VTCKDDQYEDVCKDEFAGLHTKLDTMDEAIRGNGKPGIQVRLDRLEQERISRSKITWFIIGCIATVAGSIATAWIGGLL
jgi:lysozyme family protein